ncbi:IclR family transcriptional regulator [Paenibacillus swuensis]|uniref:Glycerol operon regulatory protein n=1 Tax=Paenibacillus swuensis TaxID=1178515 RepID=A0A172TEU1_9BACL|nr:IclR family transcriptional regulator [Paenibacillus swuensis]ANE45424.1 IclR family transcriptional regulator [Paenibacillus swuensis]
MEDSKLTVRAVERALDILICFTDDTELGLTEIAGRVGLHKSTVHRLLASLENRGFVIRDDSTDKYRLGLRILELSANMSNADEPSQLWLPEMEALRDRLEETISLYVRDGQERVRIQAVQSNQAIRRVAPVGARMPLYVGASSKILLAFAEEGTRSEIMRSEHWPEHVAHSEFLEQLDEIRGLGFATSVAEREPGAAAVAVPVLNRSQQLIAVLAVSGPSSRMTPEVMREQAPVLMETAARLGRMVKA